ncbi:MAG TPA: hypothetical protein VF950_12355 [Planctomycetota bacterium]
MSDDNWITAGGIKLADRDDAWVRARGPALMQRLRAGGGGQLLYQIEARLARLEDPELLRELFLAGSDIDLFRHTPPKAAADVLLTFPKGYPGYDLAVRRSAMVADARLLPLYADGLRIPNFSHSANLFGRLEELESPDALLVFLEFIAAPDGSAKPEDKSFFATQRIHATRHIFRRALAAAKRNADFPEAVHEALARTRKVAKGRDRCMLTMARVALGRCDGIEDLAEGFPGYAWEQETWYEPLCTSRQPEALRFVARMAAEGRLYVHKALEYNPSAAALILEEALKLPVEPRMEALEQLADKAKGDVRTEAKRRAEELRIAHALPREFPARSPAAADPGRVLRESPTRIVLTCAGCGAAASSVRISDGGWYYEGAFGGRGLPRAQCLALLATLPAGSARDVLRHLTDPFASIFRDVDPQCRDCADAYCKACWKVEQTGTSGGLDIGVWYADYSATCPKGHEFTYSLGTRSYG